VQQARCQQEDVRQGRGETYHFGSSGKGLPRDSALSPSMLKFVVEQKRGDRGPALMVVLQWSFSSYLSEALATTVQIF